MNKETKLIYINGTESNPRNHIEWHKVSEFTDKWKNGDFGNKRLGQAFYLEFDSSKDFFSELFYEADEEKCWKLIWSNYKIWNNDKHQTVGES